MEILDNYTEMHHSNEREKRIKKETLQIMKQPFHTADLSRAKLEVKIVGIIDRLKTFLYC